MGAGKGMACCYNGTMTASKPHVVFQQVIKNDQAKVRRNFAEASLEQIREYLDYTPPSSASFSGNILDAAVKFASPAIVDLVLGHGAAPSTSRSTWDEWQKRAAPQNFNSDAVLSPDQAKQASEVLDVLIKHKVGLCAAIGKHHGPAHKVISAYRESPEDALEALKKLHAAGFGVDDKDEISETPLALATWVSNTSAMQWLIDQGADLSSKTVGDRSLLQFVFRDFSGTREIKKSTQPEMVMRCLGVLRSAGYDLEAEMQDKEKLSKQWSDKQSFEDVWGYLVSIVQGDQLQIDTASVSRPRKSPRL
jgi:hypothetical protein